LHLRLRVRLKPDTTEIPVRLKPDTTEIPVRLKPDTTEISGPAEAWHHREGVAVFR